MKMIEQSTVITIYDRDCAARAYAWCCKQLKSDEWSYYTRLAKLDAAPFAHDFQFFTASARAEFCLLFPT